MIKNYQIINETPIVMLTVGELEEIIFSAVQRVLETKDFGQDIKDKISTQKRYVYGIAGIASLFKVSYVTAFKMKETILKPAILQQGRKIMCDADLALDLFSRNSLNKK